MFADLFKLPDPTPAPPIVTTNPAVDPIEPDEDFEQPFYCATFGVFA